VYIFCFITENSAEEPMLERAAQKLQLDVLVIQRGRHQQSKGTQTLLLTMKTGLLFPFSAATEDELLEMIPLERKRSWMPTTSTFSQFLFNFFFSLNFNMVV
jgi:hypothetical protein